VKLKDYFAAISSGEVGIFPPRGFCRRCLEWRPFDGQHLGVGDVFARLAIGGNAVMRDDEIRETEARDGEVVEPSGVRVRPNDESPHPLVHLGDGMRVAAVAEACCAALVEFLDGVDAGWGKDEFEAWIAATSRRVGGAASDEEHVGRAHRGRYARTVRARQCRMNDVLFRRLLEEARVQLVTMLETVNAPDGDPGLALAAIRKGFVARARDEEGHEGWVPVDVPGMWPVERLLSLLAADVLTQEREHELMRLARKSS
jgi:hypothetical protein